MLNNKWFKKESPMLSFLGFGGGGTGVAVGGGGVSFIQATLYIFKKGSGGTSQPYSFPTQFQQATSVDDVVFGGVGRGGNGSTGGFLTAGGGGGGGAVQLNYPLPAPLRTTDITTNGLTFNFPAGPGGQSTCQRTSPSQELFYVANGNYGSVPDGGQGASGSSNPPAAGVGAGGGSGGGREQAGGTGQSGRTGGGGGGFGRGNDGSAGPGATGGSAQAQSGSVYSGWTATFNSGQGGGGNSGETGGTGGSGGGVSLSAPIPTPGPTNGFGGGGGGGGAQGRPGGTSEGFIIMYIQATVPDE